MIKLKVQIVTSNLPAGSRRPIQTAFGMNGDRRLLFDDHPKFCRGTGPIDDIDLERQSRFVKIIGQSCQDR